MGMPPVDDTTLPELLSGLGPGGSDDGVPAVDGPSAVGVEADKGPVPAEVEAVMPVGRMGRET